MSDTEIIQETSEQKISKLEKQITYLQNQLNTEKQLINLYEIDGSKSLFYALNRKSNEMALLLNKYNLVTMDLSAGNKEFERLQKIWSDSTGLAQAVKSLEQTSGVSGDEGKDMQPKFRITPESIADNIGNIAGSQKK